MKAPSIAAVACVLVTMAVRGALAEQITSTCKITAVDAAAHTVTLVRKTATGEKTGVAKVANTVNVTIDGQAASLNSLELPVEATVVYDTSANAVIEIRIGANMSTTGPTPARTPPPLAIAPFDSAKAKEHQEAWAKYLGVPVEMTNSIGMKLVLIPPGEFLMGSPEGEREREKSEGPQHRVRITRPFRMGVFEVTVGQFRKFVDATEYKTMAEKNGKGGWAFDSSLRFTQDLSFNWREPGFSQQDDYSVVQTVWEDAVGYCLWASSHERLAYRLPTEAEWEYACRAGTATSHYLGDDAKSLQQMANTGDLSFARFLRVASNDPSTDFMPWDDEYGCAAPVGRFLPNPFGLCDMLGNAWEWCHDWFNGEYPETGSAEDPQGAASGPYRVMRGSCYGECKPKAFRSAFRGGVPDTNLPQMSTGFRVVCEIERKN